jgi:hypothetical protein
MNDLALSTLQLCFTSMLLVTLLNSRREARRQRRKAPYRIRKRRGPLRKERLVWDYDKWHDDEFKANYRMSKDKFRELVRAVGPSLPGWTKLSRTRQAAAGGNPISIEIQLSMVLRYLAGGSYLDICRLHLVPHGSFTMIRKRVVRAIVEVLDSRGTCEFPLDDTSKLKKITEGYATSTNGVIDRCVGSLDGIAIEIIQPARRHAPKKFRSRKG